MRNFAHHFFPYFFTTLTFVGMSLGGIYLGSGLLIIFLIHPILDGLLTKVFGEIDQLETPPSNFSLLIYPFIQTGLLFYGAQLIADANSLWHQILGIISLGIITGGFGITISHELVHRKTKWEVGLGVYLLSQVSYAVFRIEHVYGHHKHVATPGDPATAPKGMSIYQFVPKAIYGVFKSALSIENKRMLKLNWWHHRFLHYGIFFIFWISLFIFLYGPQGAYIFLGQSLIAIILLELVDYIEHYGLLREKLPNGNYAPVKPKHSWDTNYFLTNTSLFNLGKHAHHHHKGSLPYQRLKTSHDANQYPFGYSLAIIIALIPPLWKKLIHPKLN